MTNYHITISAYENIIKQMLIEFIKNDETDFSIVVEEVE